MKLKDEINKVENSLYYWKYIAFYPKIDDVLDTIYNAFLNRGTDFIDDKDYDYGLMIDYNFIKSKSILYCGFFHQKKYNPYCSVMWKKNKLFINFEFQLPKKDIIKTFYYDYEKSISLFSYLKNIYRFNKIKKYIIRYYKTNKELKKIKI